MGCCVCVGDQINLKSIKNSEVNLEAQGISNSFNDLSLSSESDLPHLTEWLDFKKSKVMTESTGVFSSFNCTKKTKSGGKVLSNVGSMIDSFVVTLPSALATSTNIMK